MKKPFHPSAKPKLNCSKKDCKALKPYWASLPKKKKSPGTLKKPSSLRKCMAMPKSKWTSWKSRKWIGPARRTNSSANRDNSPISWRQRHRWKKLTGEGKNNYSNSNNSWLNNSNKPNSFNGNYSPANSSDNWGKNSNYNWGTSYRLKSRNELKNNTRNSTKPSSKSSLRTSWRKKGWKVNNNGTTDSNSSSFSSKPKKRREFTTKWISWSGRICLTKSITTFRLNSKQSQPKPSPSWQRQKSTLKS